jgi:UDP-N-acetylglucosamine--N-acetylmuramyl-(pentapeptide) pyrophosphoryl-undecaprenol N-acetylglucosamine transferase
MRSIFKNQASVKPGDPLRVVFAGGGTGGHLFPAIAIAEAFLERNPRSRILFIGSGRPLEIAVLSRTPFEFRTIDIEGIKGKSRLRQMLAALKVPPATLGATAILKAFAPHVVIGMGGYSAGPVVLAARLLGIKTALHEQNYLAGITNRLLARITHRVFVSFADTLKAKGFVNHRKIRVTGNPVRKSFLKPRTDAGRAPGNGDGPLTVFIVGGSQGAHSVNQAVLAALDEMSQKERARFQFIHQTGAADAEVAREHYRLRGFKANVGAFFDDMAARYNRADLVICRAGATTVAEVAALGKGVIFIPYPHAADNHQVLNPKALVDAGGAEMILEKDLSGTLLAQRMRHYADNPGELTRMAAVASSLGHPHAAENIVKECEELIGIKK